MRTGAACFRDEAPRRWEAILWQIPLGYMGDRREDIGRGVLALVTDLRYLTGATIALEGRGGTGRPDGHRR
jgi:hypothetical protein